MTLDSQMPLSQLPLEEAYYEHDGFWNPSAGCLSDFDQVRVSQVVAALPDIDRSVLDAGCGNGVFCNRLAAERPGALVVGLERSRAALKYVRTSRVRADLGSLPFEDRRFSAVVSLEVLEHLPQGSFDRCLAEIARVANHTIVVSVPNAQRLEESRTECPECRTLFDPDLHMRSFDDARLRRLFDSSGFTCMEVRGICEERVRRGARYYAWLARMGRRATMVSPLCPVCGFRNVQWQSAGIAAGADGRGAAARLVWPALRLARRTMDALWPRETKARWLLAVYYRSPQP